MAAISGLDLAAVRVAPYIARWEAKAVSDTKRPTTARNTKTTNPSLNSANATKETARRMEKARLEG